MYVQRFDDSRASAIHITYHISLCSSSMQEPRDPLLKVILILLFCLSDWIENRFLVFFMAIHRHLHQPLDLKWMKGKILLEC